MCKKYDELYHWIFLLLVLPLCLGATEQGETSSEPTLLIDRELRSHAITLTSIDHGFVRGLDREGQDCQFTVNQVLALIHADGIPVRGQTAFIETVDGQRRFGKLVPDEDPESVLWEHGTFGFVRIPIGKIRFIRLNEGTGLTTIDSSSQSMINDRVTLTNGDVLSGFVVALDDPILIDLGDRTVDVPIERVGCVALANPPELRSGPMIHLNTGEAIRVLSVTASKADSFEVRVANAPDQVIQLTSDQVVGLYFDAGSLLGLSEVPINRLSANGWGDPVLDSVTVVQSEMAVGLEDVRVRGPVVVSFDLPIGADRFAAMVVIPLEYRDWADFDLVFSVDDEPVFSTSMDTNHPVEEVYFDIPDKPTGDERTQKRSLTLRVDAGKRGPVRDVFIVRQGRLRLK